MMSSAGQPQPKKKQKKLWKCDVCLERTFKDYDEACQHESECKRQRTEAVVAEAEAASVALSNNEEGTTSLPIAESSNEKKKATPPLPPGGDGGGGASAEKKKLSSGPQASLPSPLPLDIGGGGGTEKRKASGTGDNNCADDEAGRTSPSTTKRRKLENAASAAAATAPVPPSLKDAPATSSTKPALPANGQQRKPTVVDAAGDRNPCGNDDGGGGNAPSVAEAAASVPRYKVPPEKAAAGTETTEASRVCAPGSAKSKKASPPEEEETPRKEGMKKPAAQVDSAAAAATAAASSAPPGRKKQLPEQQQRAGDNDAAAAPPAANRSTYDSPIIIIDDDDDEDEDEDNSTTNTSNHGDTKPKATSPHSNLVGPPAAVASARIASSSQPAKEQNDHRRQRRLRQQHPKQQQMTAQPPAASSAHRSTYENPIVLDDDSDEEEEEATPSAPHEEANVNPLSSGIAGGVAAAASRAPTAAARQGRQNEGAIQASAAAGGTSDPVSSSSSSPSSLPPPAAGTVVANRQNKHQDPQRPAPPAPPPADPIRNTSAATSEPVTAAVGAATSAPQSVAPAAGDSSGAPLQQQRIKELAEAQRLIDEITAAASGRGGGANFQPRQQRAVAVPAAGALVLERLSVPPPQQQQQHGQQAPAADRRGNRHPIQGDVAPKKLPLLRVVEEADRHRSDKPFDSGASSAAAATAPPEKFPALEDAYRQKSNPVHGDVAVTVEGLPKLDVGGASRLQEPQRLSTTTAAAPNRALHPHLNDVESARCCSWRSAAPIPQKERQQLTTTTAVADSSTTVDDTAVLAGNGGSTSRSAAPAAEQASAAAKAAHPDSQGRDRKTSVGTLPKVPGPAESGNARSQQYSKVTASATVPPSKHGEAAAAAPPSTLPKQKPQEAAPSALQKVPPASASKGKGAAQASQLQPITAVASSQPACQVALQSHQKLQVSDQINQQTKSHPASSVAKTTAPLNTQFQTTSVVSPQSSCQVALQSQQELQSLSNLKEPPAQKQLPGHSSLQQVSDQINQHAKPPLASSVLMTPNGSHGVKDGEEPDGLLQEHRRQVRDDTRRGGSRSEGRRVRCGQRGDDAQPPLSGFFNCLLGASLVVCLLGVSLLFFSKPWMGPDEDRLPQEMFPVAGLEEASSALEASPADEMGVLLNESLASEVPRNAACTAGGICQEGTLVACQKLYQPMPRPLLGKASGVGPVFNYCRLSHQTNGTINKIKGILGNLTVDHICGVSSFSSSPLQGNAPPLFPSAVVLGRLSVLMVEEDDFLEELLGAANRVERAFAVSKEGGDNSDGFGSTTMKIGLLQFPPLPAGCTRIQHKAAVEESPTAGGGSSHRIPNLVAGAWFSRVFFLPIQQSRWWKASPAAKIIAIFITGLGWLLAAFVRRRHWLRARQEKEEQEDVAAAHVAVLAVLKLSEEEKRSFRSPALRAAAWKELHRFSVRTTGGDRDSKRHFSKVTWPRVLRRLECDAAVGKGHVRRVMSFDVRTGRKETRWRWAAGTEEENGDCCRTASAAAHGR